MFRSLCVLQLTSVDSTRASAWTSRHGIVYDITPFLEDHPGGDDLLLAYAGKDMGDVMADENEHVHSKSAYEMLEEYKIGELGGMEKIVSEGASCSCPFDHADTHGSDWIPREDFHPDTTDTLSDFSRSRFLDLSKPLLRQVWNAPWSKEYYLEQVHQPRHLKDSARLFEWNILEMQTRTKWFVVPLVWGPITMFLAVLSMLQFTDRLVIHYISADFAVPSPLQPSPASSTPVHP